MQLDQVISQQQFGAIVGISQPAVSQMMTKEILSPGGTGRQWIAEYCSHLREVAAGRGANNDIDLAEERAKLARAQREGQEIKNKVARGTYAPIEALTDVLAAASQAVVDRLDQIPAALARVCPDLPVAVRELVMTQIASARNEMVRKTISIFADALEPGDIQDEAVTVGDED